MTFLSDLAAEIDQALAADRPKLRNRLRSIEQAEQAGRPFDQNLQRLWDDLHRSAAIRRARVASVPELEFDLSLPVNMRREEIAETIRQHQVSVICGETGSGKSTQIPKICLSIGRGVEGLLGHTQPRRIAARSIAARLSEELKTPPGTTVGFKVRFTDSTRPETLIKLMTDGVLLAESQHDRLLRQYDTLIIDEAHERSLNIDFLLGYLKQILPRRPDLKLIITSATIDAARFSEHFSTEREKVPVLEVSGRTYPVELRYRPPPMNEFNGEIDLPRAVADAVDEALTSGPGDMLVFLPTEREIRDVAQTLRGRFRSGGERVDILPLYARLSTEEQNRIFHSAKFRRIVLATNVAESSLTVPGITYVIDTGTARISRYSPRSKVQRLPIEPVSQASADQRKGRCGRIGPGICIRLYSEEDFNLRDRYSTPELQRTNLAAVVLQTLALQLGHVEDFPFLDPPRADVIRDGFRTLFELGAVDESKQLTPIGQRLAKLPCDPRIGRMLLAAEDERCVHEVLVIASALETQDPRERPAERRETADQSHSRFNDADSDFIGFLKLWDFIHDLRSSLSRNQWQRACTQNFLHVTRVREWLEIYRQLRDMIESESPAGKSRRGPGREGRPRDDTAAARDRNYRERYGAIHRAVLAGLLSNIAQRGESLEYKAAGGTVFHLWPGSGAFANKPNWVMAAELVETAKRYLRTVANIDPTWIERLAPHLVSRSYHDPYFHGKSARVIAFENVTLFGLTLVKNRRVNYGPLDPLTSRGIFIQQGLVDGEYETSASFRDHNRRVLEDVLNLGAKTRQREYVVDAQRQYDFFAGKLPADVFDGQSFERWRRLAERGNAKVLFMTPDDLIDAGDAVAGPDRFPDELQTSHLRLQLSYHFEPGTQRDGVTLRVPREGVNQLHAERLGWLVPGMVEEKIVALIRTLPKHVRRNLVPAPDVARRVMETLKFGEGPFFTLLAERLAVEAGEPVRAADLHEDQIAQHLRMNIEVLDEQGETLAHGRDLHEIRKTLRIAPTSEVATHANAFHRDGITKWDFGDLPEQMELSRGGLSVAVYPTLVDRGQTVSLRLYDAPPAANVATHFGLLRLFTLVATKELRAQVAWFPEMEKLRVFAATLPPARDFRDELLDLLAARTFVKTPWPRTANAFAERLAQGVRELPGVVYDIARLIHPLLKNYHEARLAIENLKGPNFRRAVDNAREQMAALTRPGFLTHIDWAWLEHYPRYFLGITSRLRKLAGGGLSRDTQAMQQLETLLARHAARAARHAEFGVIDAELDLFRWMLEEFRISLFAQELGTSCAVSPQRLEKQWLKVRET